MRRRAIKHPPLSGNWPIPLVNSPGQLPLVNSPWSASRSPLAAQPGLPNQARQSRGGPRAVHRSLFRPVDTMAVVVGTAFRRTCRCARFRDKPPGHRSRLIPSLWCPPSNGWNATLLAPRSSQNLAPDDNKPTAKPPLNQDHGRWCGRPMFEICSGISDGPQKTPNADCTYCLKHRFRIRAYSKFLIEHLSGGRPVTASPGYRSRATPDYPGVHHDGVSRGCRHSGAMPVLCGPLAP